MRIYYEAIVYLTDQLIRQNDPSPTNIWSQKYLMTKPVNDNKLERDILKTKTMIQLLNIFKSFF